jgi:hypothetical protein
MTAPKALDPVLLTVSILYLFFNSFLLPDGLLYTTLLTPFFFISLLRHKGIWAYLVFLLVTVVLALLQLPTVDHFREYVKSFILIQSVAIFVINAYYVLREEQHLTAIFKALSSMNMMMLGISILFLLIPLLRPYVWYEMSMSEGLPSIPRLKMLTYEASYYSFIIVPLFTYYFLKKTLLKSKTGILLLTLTISLLLSLSFGVLAALLISIFLVYFLNLNELGRKINLNYLAAGIVLGLLCLLLLYWFYPHNIIFDRLRNIYAGKDTSARGRTTESFVLAWDIAKMKSLYWGIGLGQLKLIGRDYIIQYYKYSSIPGTIRIPNAVAETLNIYGITGLVLRFLIIGYLFFKTKVWDNYYRLALFLFIFIYQFTGSFLFNIAEYMLWILAFSPALFPAFNRVHFKRSKQG